METFRVAHLRVPGTPGPVDLMIVFVDSSVAQKTPADQSSLAMSLQRCSLAAQRAGDVAMVWQDAFGNAGFWAPQRHRAFFTSASYEFLYSQINGELSCA